MTTRRGRPRNLPAGSAARLLPVRFPKQSCACPVSLSGRSATSMIDLAAKICRSSASTDLPLSRLLQLVPQGVRDLVDAFLGGGRDELEIDFFLAKLQAEGGIGLAHLGKVRFAQGDDFGARREIGVETRELFAQSRVVAHRVATVARIERDEMQKHARSFEVFQEPCPEPG